QAPEARSFPSCAKKSCAEKRCAEKLQESWAGAFSKHAHGKEITSYVLLAGHHRADPGLPRLGAAAAPIKRPKQGFASCCKDAAFLRLPSFSIDTDGFSPPSWYPLRRPIPS